jgi:hypothetical protein
MGDKGVAKEDGGGHAEEKTGNLVMGGVDSPIDNVVRLGEDDAAASLEGD